MPTYSIGVVPQAIGQGFQDAATVYNKGPDIVWLDSDTSITPGTGYAIYPGDSISWQSGKRMYAVCRQLLPYSETEMPNQTGRAEVQVTTDASVLFPNSERTELLYTFADPFTNTGPLQRVNVARFQAVQILYYKDEVRSDALPDYINMSVLWHDSDGNVVDDSSYDGVMGPFTNTLTLPVKGIYMSLSVTARDGSTNLEIPLERLRLVGSTLPLPLAWNFTPFLWYQNASGVVGNGVIHATATDYGAMWRAADLSAAAPNVLTTTRFYLPSITSEHQVYVQLSGAPTNLRLSTVSSRWEQQRDIYNWVSGVGSAAAFQYANDRTDIGYIRIVGSPNPTTLTYNNLSVIYKT